MDLQQTVKTYEQQHNIIVQQAEAVARADGIHKRSAKQLMEEIVTLARQYRGWRAIYAKRPRSAENDRLIKEYDTVIKTASEVAKVMGLVLACDMNTEHLHKHINEPNTFINTKGYFDDVLHNLNELERALERAEQASALNASHAQFMAIRDAIIEEIIYDLNSVSDVVAKSGDPALAAQWQLFRDNAYKQLKSLHSSHLPKLTKPALSR